MRKFMNLILMVVLAVIVVAGLSGHFPTNPCTATAAAQGKC